jgi:hypothetical protein
MKPMLAVVLALKKHHLVERVGVVHLNKPKKDDILEVAA